MDYFIYICINKTIKIMAKKKIMVVIETNVEESEFDINLINDVQLMYGNSENIIECKDVSVSWFEATENHA